MTLDAILESLEKNKITIENSDGYGDGDSDINENYCSYGTENGTWAENSGEYYGIQMNESYNGQEYEPLNEYLAENIENNGDSTGIEQPEETSSESDNQAENRNEQDEEINNITDTPMEAEKQITYYENKHELVTRVAFLCGVADKFFTDEKTIFLRDVYDEYREIERAMIIRNLCILRSQIEHNYKKINDAMFKECRSFFTLTEYYPKEALSYLTENGIRLNTSGRQLWEILVDINRLIGDRINNCRDLVKISLLPLTAWAMQESN